MALMTVDPGQPVNPEHLLQMRGAIGFERDLSSCEPITIHAKTIWTVESWPRETTFDAYLLKTADPAMMTVDGDTVTITVENGQAVYRLARDESDVYSATIPAYLISSRLSEA